MSYQHMYSFEYFHAVDEYNVQFSNVRSHTSCLPNPCKNHGLCFVGFNNSFVCICKTKYTGDLF